MGNECCSTSGQNNVVLDSYDIKRASRKHWRTKSINKNLSDRSLSSSSLSSACDQKLGMSQCSIKSSDTYYKPPSRQSR